MWLWLFPMNVLGWLNSGRSLSEYQGIPVYQIRWSPFGAFSMAWGDRILVHPNHIHANANIEYVWRRLLAHEAQHIYDQQKYGAVAFLVSYGAHWLFNFFGPHLFDWHTAYRAIFWERRAQDMEAGENGQWEVAK